MERPLPSLRKISDFVLFSPQGSALAPFPADGVTESLLRIPHSATVRSVREEVGKRGVRDCTAVTPPGSEVCFLRLSLGPARPPVERPRGYRREPRAPRRPRRTPARR